MRLHRQQQMLRVEATCIPRQLAREIDRLFEQEEAWRKKLTTCSFWFWNKDPFSQNL